MIQSYKVKFQTKHFATFPGRFRYFGKWNAEKCKKSKFDHSKGCQKCRNVFQYNLVDHFSSHFNKCIIDKSNSNEPNGDFDEIEKKIIHILETKVRPAVAKDGGDIKFKEYKDGKVKVELQGSCSGCPSSTMTLKQGVQNLLSHYIPEVKEVLAV